MLRAWQILTLIFVFTTLLLLALYWPRASRGLGCQITIDGQPVCIVPSEAVAEKVRQRIIRDAVGDAECNAFIKERWVVKPPQIVDEERAYQLLKDKVHVVVEAYAIRVNGKPVVYLPTEADARQAIALLLRRYETSGPGELVGKPKFREQVDIALARVDAAKLVKTPEAAVEALLSGGEKYYTVKKGDYPAKIAQKCGISLSELYALNPDIKGKDLRAGQKLVIARSKPRVTVVTVRELTVRKPIAPPVEKVRTYSLPAGQTKVVSPGEAGEKLLTLRATFENDRRVKAQVIRESVLKPPKPQKVLVGIAQHPSSRPAGSASRGSAPSAGPRGLRTPPHPQ